MPYHTVESTIPPIQINYTIHHPTLPPSQPSRTTPSKPWIILINGLADPQTTWSLQTPSFIDAGYTVLTYDNRGVGLSSRPSDDGELYTAEDMASDLRSLVTALDVPKPYHLMGVSMGGMIAQTYALNYCLPTPSKAPNPSSNENKLTINEFASLTLACTYASPGPFCSRLFSLWKDMAQKMSIADVMRDVALWAFTPSLFSDPTREAEVKAMEEDMQRIDEEMGLRAYLAQLNVITGFDSRGLVPQLGGGSHVKILVLAGEQDILIPVNLSKELYALIGGRNCVLRTTKGGHACMWESAEEFNHVCLEYWREVEDDAQ